jgi:predicted nucleic acid-binding protein
VIAYLDASVLLRIILEQPMPLPEWDQLEGGVSSVLASIECHRTLDRLWRIGDLSDEKLTMKRAETMTILNRLQSFAISDSVVDEARQPFPSVLGALDAIHLATALAYRRTQSEHERPILFATHDKQLARAAAALQFEVIGVAA